MCVQMVSPLEKYYDKFEDYERIAIRYNVKIEGPALKPEDDPEVVEILSATEGIKNTLALDVLYGDKEKTDADAARQGYCHDLSGRRSCHGSDIYDREAVQGIYPHAPGSGELK